MKQNIQTTPLSEERIQQEIVMHYRNNYCLLHHKPQCVIFSVPNEGKPELVRTGLLAGVSDLIILHGQKVIFLEVKTQKGVQSEKQKEFQRKVSVLGFEYKLVRSFEEYKDFINTIEF